MSQRRSSTQIALSHHRLRNSAVAARIVASTGLSPPCLVYEWGAGDGALTAELARRGLRVVAIERSRREWLKLKARFTDSQDITAVLGDFRTEDLPKRGSYSVVANLPFSLTSNAMRLLLGASNPPKSAYLIMQREAAFRWAGVGRHTEVSILAQVRARIDIVLAIHRRDFSPRPNVDSVLIRLKFRDRPLVRPREERAFADFVAQGFGRGRRTLMKNLGSSVGYKTFGHVAARHGFDRFASPGEIPLDAWLELFRGGSAKQAVERRAPGRRRNNRGRR